MTLDNCGASSIAVLTFVGTGDQFSALQHKDGGFLFSFLVLVIINVYFLYNILARVGYLYSVLNRHKRAIYFHLFSKLSL